MAGFFIAVAPTATIVVSTNGLVPELTLRKSRAIVEKFHPASLQLSISLDGVGETHDKVRGIHGAYGKVIRTLDGLRTEPRIPFGLSFTITPWNYDQLVNVYELSRKYDAGFSARFAQSSRLAYENVGSEFAWNSDMIKAVEGALASINSDRMQTQSLETKILEPYGYFLTNNVRYHRTQERMFRCGAGSDSFHLDPYGNLYPCTMLERVIGNIRDEEFDELCSSSRAAEIRRYIGTKKCHCWTECEVVPSLEGEIRVMKWNVESKVLGRRQ